MGGSVPQQVSMGKDLLLCAVLFPSLCIILTTCHEYNLYKTAQKGMLFPQESESRQIQELNGIWKFRADKSSSRNAGFEQDWWNRSLTESGDVIPMPVPSSYNDITTDKSLRDFVGWVWYERDFYVSSDWQDRRIVLRFDSAHYFTVVWVNGKVAMKHNGGHLPFEAEVSKLLKFGYTDSKNRLTVAVNNTLTAHTLPPGTVEYMKDRNRYPPGYFVQNLQFDFFNYAGIHRRVRLYTTPNNYIRDITIQTDIKGTDGIVNFEVLSSSNHLVRSGVVVEGAGRQVGLLHALEGKIIIPNVRPWWPYTMHNDAGFMYTLLVNITGADGKIDIYRQKFGIRTVHVTNTRFLINGKPFYCHGVAKHEDSDFRGKGLDDALIARDFSMLKWLGANCFRTSHYPYAEEILEQANEQGIAVIGESPGVGITMDANFDNATSLPHHLEVMEEMIQRDKNKPAIIMWSVANEPASGKEQADYYFRTVIGFTRKLDPTRPITFASASDFDQDKVVQYVDVICVNRYYSWYSDTGHTELVRRQLNFDFTQWFAKFNRPMMITEYGADTVPGLHTEPSFVFTEDYQVDMFRQYHAAFDDLRAKFLVGEMVWNFADFMTAQAIIRVVGNKKGLLTRQRQPKAAAHLIRNRYHAMMNNQSTTQHCNFPGY